MPTLTSPDGTTIAYDQVGAGPPIVLVDGAMCYRGAGPMDALAHQLVGAASRCSRTTEGAAARAPTPTRTQWSARSRTSVH